METIYLALVVYGITHLLVYKDGPAGAINYVRQRSYGLLDCVPCLAFWFCLILSLLFTPLIAGAVLGIVILLDKITTKLMI